jgi:hypothetical protein
LRIDPNPLFRRVIAPWYDTALTCWLVLVSMATVALFAWKGIAVALSNPAYTRHLWVPTTLLVLSLLVFVSVVVRILNRYFDRRFASRPR